MNKPLGGRVCVVMGAAGGMGRTTGIEMARRGANVVVTDINRRGGGEVADEIRADHCLADLKMLHAAAEALLHESLTKLEQDNAEEIGAAGTMEKYLACNAFSRIAEEAIQLHGANGMTSEHSCHLFLKRALLNEYLGSGGAHYDHVIAPAGERAWTGQCLPLPRYLSGTAMLARSSSMRKRFAVQESG
jgi:NAD(P)-dependent dehydrogenase (short-subunit alcohol dehydrogenase family)